jgi:hypothetical protein
MKAGHPVTADASFLLKLQWSLDRPPEFIIGPAEGRTRWRTTTPENHQADFTIVAGD